MPTYKNTSNVRVVVGGQTVEPGQTVETVGWVDAAALGVTKTDDYPMYNPVLYSAELTGPTTIAIPAGRSRFSVHIFAEAGEPVVHLSSASNTPPLKLYQGAKWDQRFFERLVNDIRLSGTFSSCWITILEI